jgi:hypothetical protein
MIRGIVDNARLDEKRLQAQLLHGQATQAPLFSEPLFAHEETPSISIAWAPSSSSSTSSTASSTSTTPPLSASTSSTSISSSRGSTVTKPGVVMAKKGKNDTYLAPAPKRANGAVTPPIAPSPSPSPLPSRTPSASPPVSSATPTPTASAARVAGVVVAVEDRLRNMGFRVRHMKQAVEMMQKERTFINAINAMTNTTAPPPPTVTPR